MRSIPRPGFPGEKCLALAAGADCVLRSAITGACVGVKILRIERSYGRDYVHVRAVEKWGAYDVGTEEQVSPDSLHYAIDIVWFPGRFHYTPLRAGLPAQDFAAGRPLVPFQPR